MAFIIGCVPLLLLGWAVSRAFSRPYERALPAAALLAVLVLYLFGLLGVLRAGVYAVYALGLFSGAYCVRGAMRDRKNGKALSVSISPAAMVALVAVPVICFVSRGRLLTIWDEFSHWGTVVKNMYLLDAFGSAPSSTAIFKAYPPSISLLQYYFMRLEPSFTEATLFRAKDFLTVSLLMPFFAGVTWKDGKRLLLLIMIVFALPLIDYYYFYRCILVDGVMGLLFLYALASYWDADGLDAFSFSSLSLGIFALALSKESGYGFAALALLILFADWVLARRGKRAEKAPDLPLSGKGTGLLMRFLPLLPVLALLFAVLSWKLSFRSSGAADYWNAAAALSPARVLEGLANPAPYQKDVFERFFSALFALRDDTYAVRLSPFLWIVLPVSAACLAHRAEPDEGVKKRIARLTALLLLGYALWLLALLFSYLFLFADFEALNLDGLERYSSTYQLGMFGFSVYLLVTSWRRGAGKNLISSLALLLCAELMLFSFSDLAKATLVAPQYNRYTQTQREELPDVPDFAAFLDPARDRVCLIAQQADNTGLAYYYARYMATPVYVGVVESWSVGQKRDENDDWTAAFTESEWTRALYESDYTYLYLLRVDDAFIEAFGAAFPDKAGIADGALYKIVRSGGVMTLTKVPVPTP